MKLKLVLRVALIMAVIFPAHAEDNSHHFYMSSGVSWLNSDIKTEQGWMSSIGYNYVINPTVALDVGYLDVSSDDTYTSRYSTLIPSITYKGLFGGAKVQQPIANVLMLYAKGGVSLTSYQTSVSISSTDDSLDSYLMSPYFSIGANIPAFFEPRLDLNLELSYQDRELELDYSNTILMLGAQYRF
jgi:hypothetical protein